MLSQIFEITKNLIFISKDTEQNKSDIKELKQEVKELRSANEKLRDDFNKLAILVEKLSFEIHRVAEREETEREKIVLQLHNEMLKFERRLPSGKDE